MRRSMKCDVFTAVAFQDVTQRLVGVYFCTEEGGTIFPRNSGNLLRDFTVSRPKRPLSERIVHVKIFVYTQFSSY